MQADPPVSDKNWPGAQSSQIELPVSSAKVPASQLRHTVCPAEEVYLPTSQLMHSDCPGRFWKVPAGHEVQGDCPDVPKVPTSHSAAEVCKMGKVIDNKKNKFIVSIFKKIIFIALIKDLIPVECW
ncbi:MAG: hypothetical protein ACD_73C00289G0001, partial [uncultured bacterium]